MLLSASMLMAIGVMAQETYMDGELLSPELNGTARYVGMGGAMEALGADLSTIGTNPAGIGLFRHSQAKVSFGMVSQGDASSFATADKTNLSFDQAGLVFSTRTGKKSFVNFAFNYTKSRNFDQILSAANSLNRVASQNKLTYLKYANGVFGDNPYVNNSGKLVFDAYQYNQLDYLYMNTLMASVDDNNNLSVNYDNADNYAFNRGNTGYIGEYNLNISGNSNDRFYWGLTVGISDVHYNSYSEYEEAYLGTGSNLLVTDERKITGTGFNIKGGVIIRPIETSPFRIGLSVSTPTWYDLKTENYTTLNYTNVDPGNVSDSYKFNLYTPWKFGLSLGTTIGRELALGASYEFADYGSTDNRIKDDGYYDDWGYYNENTSSDNNMNRHTEATLKGVSTLKLGLEYKPDPSLAVRLGYNYVSPMYSEDGYKDISVASPGTYVTSQSDYTNWKSTNRITCGLGYTFDKFSVDLAYQYSMQKGNFSPFTPYADPTSSVTSDYDNIADEVEVKNNRHQVLLTLGMTF